MVQTWALLLIEPTLVQTFGLTQESLSGDSVGMVGAAQIQAKREVKLNMK